MTLCKMNTQATFASADHTIVVKLNPRIEIIAHNSYPSLLIWVIGQVAKTSELQISFF